MMRDSHLSIYALLLFMAAGIGAALYALVPGRSSAVIAVCIVITTVSLCCIIESIGPGEEDDDDGEW